jgi:hypothetical protein
MKAFGTGGHEEGSDGAPQSNAAREALLQLLIGAGKPQLVYVAARLGIADALSPDGKNPKELASMVGADPIALRRVMRGLVTLGVLQNDGEVFRLTPLGEWLKSGVPRSLRGAAIQVGETTYPAWGGLLHTVQTGETSFEHIFGSRFFEYIHSRDLGTYFSQGMGARAGETARLVLAAYDFSGFKLVIDIGGGDGTLLRRILGAHPTTRGVLFDVAPVVEGVRNQIEDSSLKARLTPIAGDFRREVPAGGDCYILQHVLHDWEDTAATQILANCAGVMKPDGRVLVVESLMSEQATQSPRVVWSDLVMLVLTGGRERTLAEYGSLFQVAGLTLKRTLIINALNDLNIIEAARS